MKILLFKKEYRELIERRKKTRTYRVWKRQHIKTGERVQTNHGTILDIISVRRIKRKDITDNAAKQDGFPNRKALLIKLDAIYGGVPDNLFEICFRLVI